MARQASGTRRGTGAGAQDAAERPGGPGGPVALSVVIPMMNEGAMVEALLARLVPVLEEAEPDYEILCIDDGSTDDTWERLMEARAQNPRIRAIALSRNFGKECALTAGLDFATGRAVVPMDADLQDPPELIPEMLRLWRDGHDVVLAHRAARPEDGALKRATAGWFYSVIGRLSQTRIPPDVGDFRLMDARVVAALALLPERSRFMKGVFAWLGFRTATVEYQRPARARGAAKQNWRRLWGLALDGIVSFTAAPLKIWSYVGFTAAFGAALYALFIIVRTLIWGVDVPGYASLLVVVLFMNGVVLIGLGAIGEYMARIFIEVKQRPIYLVARHAGVAALEGKAVATRPGAGDAASAPAATAR